MLVPSPKSNVNNSSLSTSSSLFQAPAEFFYDRTSFPSFRTKLSASAIPNRAAQDRITSIDGEIEKRKKGKKSDRAFPRWSWIVFSTTLFCGNKRRRNVAGSSIHVAEAFDRVSPRSWRTKNIRGSRFKTLQRGRVIIASRPANSEADALVAAAGRLRCCYRRCRCLSVCSSTRNNRGHNSD